MVILDASTPVNELNLYASIGSVLISLTLIIFSYLNTKKTISASIQNTKESIDANNINTRKTLESKRIEEKKAEIYKKLNEFYGPFNQLRLKSQLLYTEFADKFIKSSTDGRFRTLTFLLENGVSSITGNEKILLDEIIKVGEKCENLIQDKAGLIDDEALRTNWLPKASTHYLILRLAYSDCLKGDAEKFEKHTFPREIDELIEARIKALHKDLEILK